MTDREALEALLKRFGLTPLDSEELGEVILAAKHGGVEGYRGFFASFQFDEAGKFEVLAVAE